MRREYCTCLQCTEQVPAGHNGECRRKASERRLSLGWDTTPLTVEEVTVLGKETEHVLHYLPQQSLAIGPELHWVHMAVLYFNIK